MNIKEKRKHIIFFSLLVFVVWKKAYQKENDNKGIYFGICLSPFNHDSISFFFEKALSQSELCTFIIHFRLVIN